MIEVSPERISNLLSKQHVGSVREALDLLDFSRLGVSAGMVKPLLFVSGSPGQYGGLSDRASAILATSAREFQNQLMEELDSHDLSLVNGALRALHVQLRLGNGESSISQIVFSRLAKIEETFCGPQGSLALKNSVDACRQYLESSGLNLREASMPSPMKSDSVRDNGGVGIDYEGGTRVLRARGVIFLGMSVGNSFFNKERTEIVIDWASKVSDKVILMITDGPARHTQAALGKRPEEIVSYCLKKGNQLRNYASSELDRVETHCEVILWQRFMSHPSYLHWYKTLEALYQIPGTSEAPHFRADCQSQTRAVLSRELGEMPSERQIEIGVRYILEELAVLCAAPEILQVPEIAYAYHEKWLPYQRLVKGEYDRVEKTRCGFIEYRLSEPEHIEKLD